MIATFESVLRGYQILKIICDASTFFRDCNKEEVLELFKELKNAKSSDYIPIHVIKKSASAF